MGKRIVLIMLIIFIECSGCAPKNFVKRQTICSPKNWIILTNDKFDQNLARENLFFNRGILFFPVGIGKIEEGSDDITFFITIVEEQLYPPQAWDAKYVERFDSINEAIKRYSEYMGEAIESVKEMVLLKFPSEKGNIL